MSSATAQIYLASQSPRRRELLQQIGVAFHAFVVDTDETIAATEAPADAVCRLASQKAMQGWQHPQRELDIPVLGSDTIVVCNNVVMGKPKNFADAKQMLLQLSGQTHQVLTAVACVQAERQSVRLSQSNVSFRALTEQEIEAYWHRGEPQDKAGSYAIQGYAGLWIREIQGSYSGIMGLPLFETGELLTEFAIKH